MSHNGKRLKQTAMRRARKRVLNENQRAKDRKAWTCGRKIIFSTQAEADEAATRLGQMFYRCEYGDHFHTAHLATSQRFVRRVA